jgi:hypothetical protein
MLLQTTLNDEKGAHEALVFNLKPETLDLKLLRSVTTGGLRSL